MDPVVVVTHERLSIWSKQLRPRLGDQGLRWIETRSRVDLFSPLSGRACPIVLISAEHPIPDALEDLAYCRKMANDSLILILFAIRSEPLRKIAFELGATLALAGVATPPFVAGIVERWLRIARSRSTAAGWSAPMDPPASGRAPKELQLLS